MASYTRNMKSVFLVVCVLSLAQCQIPMGQLPTKVTSFVRHAANFAVEQINSMSNCICLDVLTGIHNATVEAVMGLLYRMDITTKDSTCTKADIHNYSYVTPQRCPPKSGAAAKNCRVEVLDDPGNTPRYTLKNFNC